MIAIIRLRGQIKLSPDIKYALALLGTFRINHMALIKENETAKGTTQKLKDYVTFGQINEETLAKVLEKRAEVTGGKKISPENLKEWKLKSFDEMAKKMIAENLCLKDFPKLKTIIRLHPAVKGLERKGKKISFVKGGALGDRKEAINKLILRMI